MSDASPELSIVIPSYNEELRLPRTLERVRAWICAAAITAEVIVVDDGSTDGTARVVTERAATWPELRLVSNPGNRGKGYSVRHGALEGRGRILLFTDADLSAPIDEAPKLLDALKTHDAAIGSRGLDRRVIEVHQSKLRELAGMVFNLIVRVTLGLSFADTQCGFKAFQRDRCIILFQKQRIERFGFDPELLYLARKNGLSVAEIPVRWAHDAGTRISMARDSFGMFGEIWQVRWNAWMGRYR
ncbi:MAG TPA: dolichyl-phosphate beta-glucosyltransferase [Candidatus Acidoferrales bacterium]|nr:dolichyl-phosphate beta-glucosyltransferase [Candidatus Acidoferrales bacterium]